MKWQAFQEIHTFAKSLFLCSSSPAESGAREDDLFDWDSKAKADRGSNGTGTKRKRGMSKESNPSRKKKAPGLEPPTFQASHKLFTLLTRATPASQMYVARTGIGTLL